MVVRKTSKAHKPVHTTAGSSTRSTLAEQSKINNSLIKIFLVTVYYAVKKELSGILSIDQAKLSDVIKYTYN